VKAVIIGAVVVFLIFYVMTSPTQAATIVHASWQLAVHLAHGAGDFVNKLA
jgi:NADH:ubiquinone oxidoreductase subunit 6 (subunit J)